MSEKIYKTMSLCGKGNIALGIIVLVVGISTGILSIVCGIKMLKDKNNIMF